MSVPVLLSLIVFTLIGIDAKLGRIATALEKRNGSKP